MKRVIAISVVAIVAFAAFASTAFAQSSNPSAQNRPLAEVAKEEEARRKSVKKPAKVYTNANIRPDPFATVAGPPTTTSITDPGNASPSNVTAGVPSATIPGGTVPPPPSQDQAYWQNRIKTARDQVARTQLFADSLQTRINSLWTDFVNRDNPVEKQKLEADRNAALAELERVKKDLEEQTKAITAIEDEARRAGVPAGWLRPGA